MKPVMMTAEDISKEIFGGEVSARVISERYAFKKGFPECVQEGIRGKKFWRRAEIFAYYKVKDDAKFVPSGLKNVA